MVFTVKFGGAGKKNWGCRKKNPFIIYGHLGMNLGWFPK